MVKSEEIKQEIEDLQAQFQEKGMSEDKEVQLHAVVIELQQKRRRALLTEQGASEEVMEYITRLITEQPLPVPYTKELLLQATKLLAKATEAPAILEPEVREMESLLAENEDSSQKIEELRARISQNKTRIEQIVEASFDKAPLYWKVRSPRITSMLCGDTIYNKVASSESSSVKAGEITKEMVYSVLHQTTGKGNSKIAESLGFATLTKYTNRIYSLLKEMAMEDKWKHKIKKIGNEWFRV